jgi:hypothetical protein
MELIPGFGDNLFAISGVSGGSVGAATYTAVKRQQLETGKPEDLLARVKEILGEDFLSPVVAGLLFPDLSQRFLPFPIASADRQRFLEKSWEDALGPVPNAFTDAFTALYGRGYGDRLPSLLLNATVVDSGRRAKPEDRRAHGHRRPARRGLFHPGDQAQCRCRHRRTFYLCKSPGISSAPVWEARRRRRRQDARGGRRLLRELRCRHPDGPVGRARRRAREPVPHPDPDP